MMGLCLQTERLQLVGLTIDDAGFMFNLTNSPDWIKFIGDRQIYNHHAAIAYVEHILQNKDVQYWVVSRNHDGASIGVITLIKRDYLKYQDIGFAFLPEYYNQGYAFEATTAVLKAINEKVNRIQAITVEDNTSSVKLLVRLGFLFESQMNKDGEQLLVYVMTIRNIDC